MITTVGWQCNNVCACACVCWGVCVSAVLISENRPGREQDGEQREATGGRKAAAKMGDKKTKR